MFFYSLTAQHSALLPVKDQRKTDDYCDQKTIYESANKGMAKQVQSMKERWEDEINSIEGIYKEKLVAKNREIREIRRKLSRTMAEEEGQYPLLAELKLKLDLLNDELHEAEKDCEGKNVNISLYEAENKFLKSKFKSLEKEVVLDEEKIASLSNNYNQVADDIFEESSKSQALKDQLQLEENVHQQQITVLSTLASLGSTEEKHKFWENATADTLRIIQERYKEQNDLIMDQLQASCNLAELDISSGDTDPNIDLPPPEGRMI